MSDGAGRMDGRSILIVEDEPLIGMLLDDMLCDLGYRVAGTASRVEDAVEIARDGHFDAAILDVKLNQHEVFPVADILAGRGIPFLFATGYGEPELPPALQDRPTLQKPFRQDALQDALAGLFG